MLCVCNCIEWDGMQSWDCVIPIGIDWISCAAETLVYLSKILALWEMNCIFYLFIANCHSCWSLELLSSFLLWSVSISIGVSDCDCVNVMDFGVVSVDFGFRYVGIWGRVVLLCCVVCLWNGGHTIRERRAGKWDRDLPPGTIQHRSLVLGGASKCNHTLQDRLILWVNSMM